MRRLIVAALGLLTLGAAASTPQGEVRSALQTPAAMREMAINGVRLRMSRPEADAALHRAGFSLLRESEGSFIYTNSERELHTAVVDESGRIIEMSYLSQLSADEELRVEEGRQAIIAAYGEPAYWFRWVHEGRLRDRFVYASHADFLDMSRVSQIQSCRSNWACEKVRDDVDCRQVLKPEHGVVLSVGYVFRGAYQTLTDYSAGYAKAAADPKFLAMDTSEAFCPEPMLGH